MSFLLRLLIPLVGYACVATVVSAGIGLGYLRHTGKLDDETLYRMAALVHGIDLEKIEGSVAQEEPDVPREEPSFDEVQQHAQAATIHFDAKRKQLVGSLREFEYQFKRLNEETEKYTNLRRSVEEYLKNQKQELLSAQMLEVRQQLEELNPKNQAKKILVKMIQDGRVDEVILLLGTMKARSRREILNTFVEEKDVEMLYLMQQKMLSGGTSLPFIDEKLKELQELSEQER